MDFWLGLILVAVGLPLAGAIYEQLGAARDRQRLARRVPSQQVTLNNGTVLHLNQQGTGGPSVILDAGIGGTSLDWVLVQAELAKHTTVIAVDRAGYGWSGAPVQARTPQNIVDELHEALHAANVPTPYILVSHALAGFYGALYAQTYPQDLAGMVWVDVAHPDMVKQHKNEVEVARLRRVNTLRKVGLVRFMLRRVIQDRLKQLPPELHRDYVAVTLKDIPHIPQEAADLFSNLPDYPATLGDTPLVVITRSPLETETSQKRHELQQSLAALSATSLFIVAETANHYIQLIEPQRVIDGVLWVMKKS